MIEKRPLIFFSLIFATAISALLYAKGEEGSRGYGVIYASRGRIWADPTTPTQGRLILTQAHNGVTYFPQKGKAYKVPIRPFLTRWPQMRPEGALTFQQGEENVHLTLLLSHPYYDPAENLLTFDLSSPTPLTPYDQLAEVTLYVYE